MRQVLDTQYRMHPAITAFPSREFYAGRLHDAPGMAERMAAPWHAVHAGLGPLAFYDVRGERIITAKLQSAVPTAGRSACCRFRPHACWALLFVMGLDHWRKLT